MYAYERCAEGDDEPPTGRYFEASHCEFAEELPWEADMLDRLLRPDEHGLGDLEPQELMRAAGCF